MQSDFLYLVENELVEVREKYQTLIGNPHEAYGMIAPKLIDFGGIVFKSLMEPIDKPCLLAGLVQIAAMCYRAAEDLQLVEVAEPEPAHEWCKEHKGLRFRADDPNQEKLGMAVNYKCLHGVEWTITGACLDALRPDQFKGSCDCYPVKIPAILKV